MSFKKLCFNFAYPLMRRILRKIVENDLENIGDTSTLLNPECVEKIINGKKA